MKTVIQLPVILSMILSFPTSGYAVEADNIPPTCEATFVGVNADNEKFAQFTAHDNTSLLKTTITEMVNSTTTVYVPEDDKIVVFAAIKIDQTQKAIINGNVTDKAGNVSDCINAISVQINNGNSVEKTYPNIPHKTGGQVIVHVKNGAAGIDELSIVVNGTEYLTTFSDGEYKQIDISSSMLVGNNNKIRFTGSGNPGESAAVIIYEY